jgi:hypothetical protein
MTAAFDFTRLRRTITIYVVVQAVLILILIYMALNFQTGLRLEGHPQRFLHSIVVTFILQLILFYPINKFADRQAKRDVESCATGLKPEEMKALRGKRMVGDIIKIGIIIFYVTFVLKMPPNKFFLSIAYFSFILTPLTYFQCFNFSARRHMRAKE